MPGLYTLLTPEKLDTIRKAPFYRELREGMIAQADAFLAEAPAYLKFADLHLFATTGNRSVYEKTYTGHLDRLESYFAVYLITEDEKYLNALTDIVWDVCGVESWSIPAHVKEDLSIERRRRNLDLVSTRVGMIMAEIYHFLGDKLPDLVRRRIEYEMRVRILDSYFAGDEYWWEYTNNNWAAVCAANILCSFILMGGKEETERAIPRLEKTIEGFLLGFDDEGCCKEGYGYWKYGFGHFCIYAAALREYTDGKIDYFKLPKIRAIAGFEESVAINDTQCISFSDCGQGFAPSMGLSHFLKTEYPDLGLPKMGLPTMKKITLYNLLWLNPALEGVSTASKAKVFRENQWFIYHSEAFNFACKAGCNNEFHNHNDIGSFVFSKNGKMTFSDPGGGEYTRQYFSSERYSILAASSRGHSVPIINGQYQVTGTEKSVILAEEKDRYAFTMKNGYDVESLNALNREFRAEKDALVITDTYDFEKAPDEVIERFVSLLPITVDGGKAVCGDSELVFDTAVFDASVTTEDFRVGVPLYQLNLKVKVPDAKMTLSVKVC